MQDHSETSDALEYRFQGFRLDLLKFSLYGPDEKLIPLSSRGLFTLQLLIEHRGQPLSKATLLEKVWPDVFVEENNLNQVISSIRKALGDTKEASKFIKTLVGKGYCFVAEIEKVEVPDPSVKNSVSGEAISGSSLAPELHSGNTSINQTPKWRLRTVYLPAFLLVVLVSVAVSFSFFSLEAPLTRTANLTDTNDTSTIIAGQATTTVSSAIPDSIALMPLSNLTSNIDNNNDSDSDFFALELHDELINQLSQVSNLKLVARQSVLSPEIEQLSIKEVSELLHVESIITGSILFVENQARLKLQMLEPETGVIKWAFDYDVDTDNFDNLFAAQQDIATTVSQAIQTDMGYAGYNFVAKPTQSFEAYRYNLAARRAYYNLNIEKSWSLSKQALALDPEFHGALYNFSRAHFFLASNPLQGMTTKEHLNQGLESAQHLIKLAPEKDEGYVLKAVALGASGQWSDSMDIISLLKERGSSHWEMQLLAPILMSLGQFQSTIEILESSLQEEPLNGYARGYLMESYEVVGNSIQARLEYDMGEELTPNWWGDVVNYFLTLGRGEEFTDLANLQGTSDEIKSLLADLYRGEHEKVISRLNNAYYETAQTSSIFMHYAAIAAAIGDHATAVHFITRSTDRLPLHLQWIWLPVFRETWQHPEFKNLLENIGVMDYWQENGKPEICDTTSEYFICAEGYFSN